MNTKIYAYDNQTGKEIPTKINVFPVDMLLGSTISEIHNSMTDCQLFFVFTHINGADFLVKNIEDKSILDSVLAFGKYEYKVIKSPENIWYSDKARTNIVISDSVDLSSDSLAMLLSMVLNEINAKDMSEGKLKQSDMYTVKNTRNNNIIFKTPIYQDAVQECDKNPCTVIINKNNEIIYTSSFGKVQLPKPIKHNVKKHKLHNINFRMR